MIVELAVVQGRAEQARGWVRVEDGAVVERGDGPFPGAADVTFTATPADAQALHDGTLDLSVGFMRGQVKVAGDPGTLLRLLPLTGGRDPKLRVADLLP